MPPMPQKDDSLTTLALAIAAEGWPVVACRESKIPYHKNWYENAPTDPRAVRADFGWGLVRHIGVPTGSRTKLFVIDIDVKHGPCDWHEKNEHLLRKTRRHTTPTNGFHYLFSTDLILKNSVGRLAPGVDTRGENGHIGWPGSPGRTIDRNLPVQPLQDLPWLLEAIQRIQPPPIVEPVVLDPLPHMLADIEMYPGAGTSAASSQDLQQKAIDQIAAAIQSVKDANIMGTRHPTLSRAAYTCGGLLAAAGLTEDIVRPRLMQALEGKPDINFRNANTTAHYQIQAGMKRPIDPADKDLRFSILHRVAHELLETGPPDNSYRLALQIFNKNTNDPLDPSQVEIAAANAVINHFKEANNGG
jgi:hypothetical protein